MGLEPTTLCLGSRCSTTELLPLAAGILARPVKMRPIGSRTFVQYRCWRAFVRRSESRRRRCAMWSRAVTAVIEAEGLVKQFGRQRAVDGLHLRVERGGVYAYRRQHG